MKVYVKKVLKICVISTLCIALTVAAALLAINAYVILSSSDRVITVDEAAKITDADCVLVLGCLVKSDGVPSHMLADRLETGVAVYKSGAAPKMLMSGDHGRADYDEVKAMKSRAVDSGVPSSDVFSDHAGFSTYESIYRAKEIFGADKIIIVTQEYHLYRALYIAEGLGVEAYGVPADLRTYSGQIVREIREILARSKDFLTSIFKPEPTYLGEKIDIRGDGDVTND